MKNNNAIAIVSASLGLGGAERFASLLGLMLTSLGYEVHHIIIMDIVDYEYKGKLINLGKLFENENFLFRGSKKGFYISNYLKKNSIETIIDIRSRPILSREIFTKWIYGNRKTYFMIHSSNLEMYLPKSIFWAKYLYGNAAKLVFVSKEIEEKVKANYGFANTKTIYNPVVFPEIQFEKPIGIPDNYFLFFGRLEDKIKNLSLLIKAYEISKLQEKNIYLLILGEGSDKELLLNTINSKNLTDFVHIIPFQKNILPYIQQARCVVLTSRFEGFPMSLVESLAAGTPVIAVDCETGPREIIINNYNGLLVENHNPKALAEAMNTMATDENLYQRCKNNAKKSVEHLSLENIAQQWKQLLEEQ
ncbi:glycosyltransferase [Flavobacterium sp. RSB2_4_14]|uniref:glycosyltransferase n=1 Tax=Flavobacterium sp. RSB2_4_14 TaxID=3447665 RepID=UPI003F3C75C7